MAVAGLHSEMFNIMDRLKREAMAQWLLSCGVLIDALGILLGNGNQRSVHLYLLRALSACISACLCPISCSRDALPLSLSGLTHAL